MWKTWFLHNLTSLVDMHHIFDLSSEFEEKWVPSKD